VGREQGPRSYRRLRPMKPCASSTRDVHAPRSMFRRCEDFSEVEPLLVLPPLWDLLRSDEHQASGLGPLRGRVENPILNNAHLVSSVRAIPADEATSLARTSFRWVKRS
jgi:hypothetical protein